MIWKKIFSNNEIAFQFKLFVFACNTHEIGLLKIINSWVYSLKKQWPPADNFELCRSDFFFCSFNTVGNKQLQYQWQINWKKKYDNVAAQFKLPLWLGSWRFVSSSLCAIHIHACHVWGGFLEICRCDWVSQEQKWPPDGRFGFNYKVFRTSLGSLIQTPIWQVCVFKRLPTEKTPTGGRRDST